MWSGISVGYDKYWRLETGNYIEDWKLVQALLWFLQNAKIIWSINFDRWYLLFLIVLVHAFQRV